MSGSGVARDDDSVDEQLLIDVGHTRLKFARCEYDAGEPWPRIQETQSFLEGNRIPWEEIADWFHRPQGITAAVAGTDQKKVTTLLQSWPSDWPPPRLTADKLALPIRIEVDFPERVGIDRLLNGIAANAIREPRQPVINVCSGTAVTIDLISGDGTFCGGAILPGILLTSRSLHDHTTTLPLIDPWRLLKNEPPVVGRNTEAAIASGVFWGHLGAVKEIVARETALLDGNAPAPLVLVTGGAAGILAPYLPGVRHEPQLTLAGLAIAARARTSDA